MGLEPTTFGTTIRRSNQLSYVHHLSHFLSNAGAKLMPILFLCKFIRKKVLNFNRDDYQRLSHDAPSSALRAMPEHMLEHLGGQGTEYRTIAQLVKIKLPIGQVHLDEQRLTGRIDR